MAPENANSTEEIYEAVRERILSGRLSAADPVRQDALAQSLGVSKIPLREALVRLEQDGLLNLERNRGFFVRPLDFAEAEEVFALRLKLEPECVAAAALKATRLEQDEARRALDALEREIEAKGPRVGQFNRAFHQALARPAARTVTLQLLERLHVLSERYVREHLEPQGRKDQGRQDKAQAEHRLMLTLWLTRGEADVVKSTAQHIAGTLQDLRAQLAPGA